MSLPIINIKEIKELKKDIGSEVAEPKVNFLTTPNNACGEFISDLELILQAFANVIKRHVMVYCPHAEIEASNNLFQQIIDPLNRDKFYIAIATNFDMMIKKEGEELFYYLTNSMFDSKLIDALTNVVEMSKETTLTEYGIDIYSNVSSVRLVEYCDSLNTVCILNDLCHDYDTYDKDHSLYKEIMFQLVQWLITKMRNKEEADNFKRAIEDILDEKMIKLMYDKLIREKSSVESSLSAVTDEKNTYLRKYIEKAQKERELTIMLNQLYDEKIMKEKARKEIKEIKAHPKVDKIDIQSNRIIVTTKMIETNFTYRGTDYYKKLGRYEITIKDGGEIKLKNLDNISVNRRCHPHAFDHGGLCYGNYNETIATYLSERQYGNLITFLLLYLESVNPDDSIGKVALKWPQEPNQNIMFNRDSEIYSGLIIDGNRRNTEVTPITATPINNPFADNEEERCDECNELIDECTCYCSQCHERHEDCRC